MCLNALTRSGIPPSVIATLVLALLLPAGQGCSHSDGPAPSPEGGQAAGTVVAASECGGFPSDERTTKTPDTQDCIEYTYDGMGTLGLRHVNAGLNCCPGEIAVPITIAGDQITLDECKNLSGCHCNCLFDIDLEIHDLPSGTYLLRVLEPLVEEGDAPLEFELTLSGPTSGRHCVPRTHYPWGVGQ